MLVLPVQLRVTNYRDQNCEVLYKSHILIYAQARPTQTFFVR